MKFSFSSISTYKQCPRKFKYKLDRVSPQEMDRTALLKGSAVHSLIENYPERSTHQYAENYSWILRKFLTSPLSEYLETTGVREYKFGLDQNLKPCQYSDPDVLFRGIIDYVCIKDATLNLIDWKTGKGKELQYQNFDQLMYYAVHMFERYPVEKIRISFVYVEELFENSVVLERRYLDRYRSELSEIITEIKTSTEFPKKPSKLCEYCEFGLHCRTDV